MNTHLASITHQPQEQGRLARTYFKHSKYYRKPRIRRTFEKTQAASLQPRPPRPRFPGAPNYHPMNDLDYRKPEMWTAHHVEDRLVRTITRASKLRREAYKNPCARIAATKDLLSALESLRREVEPPAEVALNLKFEPAKRFALVMAVEMRLVDYLAERGEGAEVTAKELGAVLGFEDRLIVRVMRLLTVQGIGIEVDVKRYAPNEMLRHICKPGFKGRLNITSPISADLPRYIQNLAAAQRSEPPTSIDNAPKPISNPDHDPQSERPSNSDIHTQSLVSHTFGQTFWSLLAQDPELRSAFDASMEGNFSLTTAKTSSDQSIGRSPWWDKYPLESELEMLKSGMPGSWEKKPPAIVDVGGGRGHYLAALKAAYPLTLCNERLVLQDLEEPIRKAREDPEIGGRSIECVVHDFLGPQSIKGAHIYYLRNILHDLPDHFALTVLTNIAQAMDPARSRMLIDDVVMPERNAPLEACGLDMLMLILVGGKERTLDEFERLCGEVVGTGGEKVGLKVQKVWWGEYGELQPVIEVRRVPRHVK
ncbi:MAG: hypothetical protein M1831_005459 [Alyxoria varia]|nr:MAG: hypothetical protein M1831_005459 [Alyxoria varia]